MSPTPDPDPTPAPRHGLRRAAWALAGVVLLLGILPGLAATLLPPWLRGQAEQHLSQTLGRPVTVGAVELQPWRLTLGVRDLAVGAAPGSTEGPQLAIAHVSAEADLAGLWPIWRPTPVLRRLTVDGLRGRVTRLAEGRYDVDDILARLAGAPAAPEPSSGPPRLALHDLQLHDAALRFDDRPAGMLHRIDALTMSLPFVSTLPDDAATPVTPRLAFTLNGSRFDSAAQGLPFASLRQGELTLQVPALDLAPYRGYLPAALPLRLQRATLSADLRLRLRQPAGQPPQAVLSGTLGARDVALADARGEALASWTDARLELRDVQPLARRVALGKLRVDGLVLSLARGADGRVVLPGDDARPAAASTANPPSPGSAGAEPAPWALSLDALMLRGARLQWRDASLSPPAALGLDGIDIDLQHLAWPLSSLTGPADGRAAATLRGADGQPAGRLTAEGSAGAAQARLALGLERLQLSALAPWLRPLLAPRLSGSLSAQGHLDWAAAAAAATGPALRLTLDTASLDGLRLDDEAAGRARSGRVASNDAPDTAPPLSVAQLSLRGLALDLATHHVAIAHLALQQPQLALTRDATGQWNLLRWAGVSPAAVGQGAGRNAPPRPAARPAAQAPMPAPWTVRVDTFALDGGQLRLSDALAGSAAAPLRADIRRLAIEARHLDWPAGAQPLDLRVAAQVSAAASAADAARGPRARPSSRPSNKPSTAAPSADAGTLAWHGQLRLAPLKAQGQLDLKRFPLALFAPYAADTLPLAVARAEVGYHGRVAASLPPEGLRLQTDGDLLLADVALRTRPGRTAAPAGAASAPATATTPASSASGVTAVTAATEAQDLLAWRTLTLDRLALRIAPGARPDIAIGSLRLDDFYSRLVISPDGRFNLQDVAGPGAAASTPATASNVASATPPAAAASAAVAPSRLPFDLVVNATRITGGTVDFSDHFIRPNYSARLTQLSGQLGAFRAGSAEMADIEIRGRAAETADLLISGRLNPTANPPVMDLSAQATDLELAPLSPYSGKYAGLAIARGKLEVRLHYRISPEGQLDARHQIVLHQLSFGDAVDSPEATRLPVRLAVALLKDRNGVIDLDLPVSGSLKDPQFSIAGLVWRLLGNLVAKAVTSPFALLSAGSDESLDSIAFAAGGATLDAAAAGTLDTVARLLNERPALVLTLTGSADARLDGAAPAASSGSGATVAAKAAAAATAAAAAASAPDAARAQTGIDEAALRSLALQRAMAVRDGLAARGLPTARLFLAAPQVEGLSPGPADAPPPRAPVTRLLLSAP